MADHATGIVVRLQTGTPRPFGPNHDLPGDAGRNRADNGPENLAILRRFTLNLLRTAHPKLAGSRKRKSSGWSCVQIERFSSSDQNRRF